MKTEASSSQWLKVVITVVLLLGIAFRFVNLDRKPYWHDETYTSLYLSGYSAQEAIQHLFAGQIVKVKDLLHYQYPSSEHSVLDTIDGLATKNAQHPPLYYALARLWVDYFGASIAAMRVLPAAIGLLALPGIYWLGLELFASPAVGWMAMSLWAVSPLSIRYAQEARQYSLWIVIVLCSSALLLRAMHSKVLWHWILYLWMLIAGLYCHVLFALTLLGHGFYVLLIERFRLSQNAIRYLLAAGVSIISFIPWLWTMWQHRETIGLSTAWTKEPVPLLTLLKSWGIHICQLFAAWHFRYDERLVYLAIPILFLSIFACVTLFRHGLKRQWLFLFISMGVSFLPILLPDLIWGGRRSMNTRYLLPFYLGIDLAIAYLLVDRMTQKYATAVHRKTWQSIAAVLMTCSIVTCAISSQATSWWGWSEFDVEIPKIVNRAVDPLLVSDMPLGVIMPLSHRLDPDTKILLSTEPETLKIPDLSGDVFLYNPSDRLKSVIAQQRMKSEIVYQFQDDTLTLSLYKLQAIPEIKTTALLGLG
ncbi:hypothetical protein [Altericista sp. CCNU0014]|uniref:glycosyltransferase family 39 protein n=1 Tax=Altericista sp. CCNU0014 TaxID=3082949 RepID=UPI00384B5C41